MRRYFANRLFKFGAWLLVLGSGPLLTVIMLANVHLWPDPDPNNNPNPIGLGLLAGLSFWPALACMAIGALQVRGSPVTRR